MMLTALGLGLYFSVFMALAIVGLHQYSAPPVRSKGRPVLGLWMWAFLTLWFMAKAAFKNVPDYQGDRAAGVRTSATVFATQRRAAWATTVATFAAYSLLLVPVALGLESARVLWALSWLLPIGLNCARLVRAGDGAAANRVLKQDMWLSTGFLATLLALVDPNSRGIGFVVAAALLLFGSDALGIDSRRASDVRKSPANAREGPLLAMEA